MEMTIMTILGMMKLMLNLMSELMTAQRFGGLEEKKVKSRRGEEEKNETDDKSTSSLSSSMMLDEDLVLGPETAFLAEGSVHDTGGMVEWAGTVGKDYGLDVKSDRKFEKHI